MAWSSITFNIRRLTEICVTIELELKTTTTTTEQCLKPTEHTEQTHQTRLNNVWKQCQVRHQIFYVQTLLYHPIPFIFKLSNPRSSEITNSPFYEINLTLNYYRNVSFVQNPFATLLFVIKTFINLYYKSLFPKNPR